MCIPEVSWRAWPAPIPWRAWLGNASGQRLFDRLLHGEVSAWDRVQRLAASRPGGNKTRLCPPPFGAQADPWGAGPPWNGSPRGPRPRERACRVGGTWGLGPAVEQGPGSAPAVMSGGSRGPPGFNLNGIRGGAAARRGARGGRVERWGVVVWDSDSNARHLAGPPTSGLGFRIIGPASLGMVPCPQAARGSDPQEAPSPLVDRRLLHNRSVSRQAPGLAIPFNARPVTSHPFGASRVSRQAPGLAIPFQRHRLAAPLACHVKKKKQIGRRPLGGFRGASAAPLRLTGFRGLGVPLLGDLGCLSA